MQGEEAARAGNDRLTRDTRRPAAAFLSFSLNASGRSPGFIGEHHEIWQECRRRLWPNPRHATGRSDGPVVVSAATGPRAEGARAPHDPSEVAASGLSPAPGDPRRPRSDPQRCPDGVATARPAPAGDPGHRVPRRASGRRATAERLRLHLPYDRRAQRSGCVCRSRRPVAAFLRPLRRGLQLDRDQPGRRAMSPAARSGRVVDPRDGHGDRRILRRPEVRSSYGTGVASHRMPFRARRLITRRDVRSFAGSHFSRSTGDRSPSARPRSRTGAAGRSQGAEAALRLAHCAGVRPGRTAQGRRFIRAAGWKSPRRPVRGDGQRALRLGGPLGRTGQAVDTP